MEAYTLTVAVDGRVEHEERMVDPFVTSMTTVPRRMWWRVLLHGLLVETRVSTDPERIEQVMELNPDYLGPPGSPSRERWQRALNTELYRLAEVDP